MGGKDYRHRETKKPKKSPQPSALTPVLKPPQVGLVKKRKERKVADSDNLQ